jgi:hypothetical protein
MKNESYIFSIDAGKAGTGYAVWRYSTWGKRDPMYPIENGVIQYKDVERLLRVFKDLVYQYTPILAYIEDAALMLDSERGQVCATSGALVTFSKFIGRLEQIFAECYTKVEMVSVASWKGTLSKEIIKQRIIRRLPRINCKSHDWDAVGIGLYAQGHLHKNQKRKPNENHNTHRKSTKESKS